AGGAFPGGGARGRFGGGNRGAVGGNEEVGAQRWGLMEGGIVIVLGPTGINFGAGMTGGLAYLPQEHLDEFACNLDFVSLAPCSLEESFYLRCAVLKHCLMTGSPRATTLLNSGPQLSLVRVQPKHLPCSVEHTWGPILQRLTALIPLAVNTPLPLRTADSVARPDCSVPSSMEADPTGFAPLRQTISANRANHLPTVDSDGQVEASANPNP